MYQTLAGSCGGQDIRVHQTLAGSCGGQDIRVHQMLACSCGLVLDNYDIRI